MFTESVIKSVTLFNFFNMRLYQGDRLHHYDLISA